MASGDPAGWRGSSLRKPAELIVTSDQRMQSRHLARSNPSSSAMTIDGSGAAISLTTSTVPLAAAAATSSADDGAHALGVPANRPGREPPGQEPALLAVPRIIAVDHRGGHLDQRAAAPGRAVPGGVALDGQHVPEPGDPPDLVHRIPVGRRLIAQPPVSRAGSPAYSSGSRRLNGAPTEGHGCGLRSVNRCDQGGAYASG